MTRTLLFATLALAACAPAPSRDADSTLAAAEPGAGAVDAGRDTLEVVTLVVNRGTHGMAARTRWAFSADGRSLLVVEDPTAVENEPVPNGFLFASERGPFVLQQDSVWDVMPTPDWRRIAYGRAYGTRGERDSVSPAAWDSLARRAGLPTAVVRRGAFPSSGMTVAYAVSRPVVVDVSPRITNASRPDSVLRRALSITGGWRVRWTPDGNTLALGVPPERVADDAPAAGWLLVDPATGSARGGATGPAPVAEDSLATVRWTDGPVLDISLPVDLNAARTLTGGSYTIESRDGVIRIGAGGAGERGRMRVVGRGLPLAASATGQFIVALAPWAEHAEYEVPVQLVVYQVVDAPSSGSRP